MGSEAALDGLQAEGNPPPWKGPSSALAAWAPGLCEAIAEGSEIDCVTCVMGGGVGRRHGRVEHPEAEDKVPHDGASSSSEAVLTRSRVPS